MDVGVAMETMLHPQRRTCIDQWSEDASLHKVIPWHWCMFLFNCDRDQVSFATIDVLDTMYYERDDDVGDIGDLWQSRGGDKKVQLASQSTSFARLCLRWEENKKWSFEVPFWNTIHPPTHTPLPR